jgi:hypothetical protein
MPLNALLTVLSTEQRLEHGQVNDFILRSM